MNAPTAMVEAVDIAGDGLTRNGFLDGRFELYQPKKGLRAGSDAMFLAASIPARSGETVVEAGLGTGAAAMALLTRVEGVCVTGVERHTPHAILARRNADLNLMGDRLRVVDADILSARLAELTGAGDSATFDHAMANPPYYEAGRVRDSDTASKATAHVMPPGGLTQWVAKLVRLTRPGGTVTFIHRPEVLPELLGAMEHGCGRLLVLPLLPHERRAASRVLVQGTKGSAAPLQLVAPLLLHDRGGGHTCQSEAVLRGGKSLELENMACGQGRGPRETE